MALQAEGSENKRIRVGIVILVLGLLLLLWAWGSWMYRTAVRKEGWPVDNVPRQEASMPGSQVDAVP